MEPTRINRITDEAAKIKKGHYPRPLRIEFAGALYHVTWRGDQQEAIYEDEEDRRTYPEILAEVLERFHWFCYAYCLMGNHYHLVIETLEGNPQRSRVPCNGQWLGSYR